MSDKIRLYRKYERFRLLLVEARNNADLSQAQLAKRLVRPQIFRFNVRTRRTPARCY